MTLWQLRERTASLEDSLRIVGWREPDTDERDTAMEVVDCYYSTHATNRRGLVIVVHDERHVLLADKVLELEQRIEELEDELSALKKTDN